MNFCLYVVLILRGWYESSGYDLPTPSLVMLKFFVMFQYWDVFKICIDLGHLKWIFRGFSTNLLWRGMSSNDFRLYTWHLVLFKYWLIFSNRRPIGYSKKNFLARVFAKYGISRQVLILSKRYPCVYQNQKKWKRVHKKEVLFIGILINKQQSKVFLKLRWKHHRSLLRYDLFPFVVVSVGIIWFFYDL